MLTRQLLREIREEEYNKGLCAVVGAFFILLITVNMFSFTVSVSVYNSTSNLHVEKCDEPYYFAKLYSAWIFPFVILGIFVCCSSFLPSIDYSYLLYGGCIMNIFVSTWSLIMYSILISVRNDMTEDCTRYWNILDERVLFFLDFSYVGLIISAFGFLINAFTGCYLFTN
jgi:hypothetical protein